MTNSHSMFTINILSTHYLDRDLEKKKKRLNNIGEPRRHSDVQENLSQDHNIPLGRFN